MRKSHGNEIVLCLDYGGGYTNLHLINLHGNRHTHTHGHTHMDTRIRMHIKKKKQLNMNKHFGPHQSQFPSCGIILQSCKMLSN